MHLKCCCAELCSFRIKCYLSQEYLMKKTNELSIYGMLFRSVSIFYLQNLSFIFQVQEKSKACRSLKLILSSSCFIVDDSHVKIVWLHGVVFSKYIFYFWDNVHLLKFYPVKVPQNCFNSFNYSNQTCVKFPNFRVP